MSLSALELQIQTLPDNPGVYQYYDKEGKILYVGKAKNLKNRISSYFTNQKNQDNKTRRLVQQIKRVEFTIVHSEFDALLLENNLIKKLHSQILYNFCHI